MQKRKKARNVQPTRGDQVLVSFLADFNRPEIASFAGENPLDADTSGDIPESPGGEDSDEQMDVLESNPAPIKQTLAHFADTAFKISEHNDANGGGFTIRNGHERPRPTIVTKPIIQQEAVVQELASKSTLNSRGPMVQSNGTSPLRHDSWGSDRRRSSVQISRDPDSIATSPQLRQYTINASQGSPAETLPAMQTSPSLSAKSPASQQSLPSIQSQLGPLVDGPPSLPNIPPTNRQASFSTTGSVHSPPPQDFAPPRGPPPYPSLSSRSNGPYQTAYPAAEPSPASTQSGPSPREQYAPSQTPRSMSPPSKFGPRQYSGTQGLPTEVPMPMSAGSQASYRSMGSEPSPVSERINMDSDRPILPPLTNGGPLVGGGGGYKCEYVGCTAQPFLTQYLLK